MGKVLAEKEIAHLHHVRVTLELGLDGGWADYYEGASEYQMAEKHALELALQILQGIWSSGCSVWSCLEYRDEQPLSVGPPLPAGLYFSGTYGTSRLRIPA